VSFERDLLKQQYRCPFLYPYPGKCLEQTRERERNIFVLVKLLYPSSVHRATWKESQQNDDDEDDDSTMDVTTDAPTSLVALAANADHPLEHEITMNTITDGSSNTSISVDPARNIAMASSSIPLATRCYADECAGRRRTNVYC
jgi:hypothetical protein